RNARTGELTPAGMVRWARAKSSSLRFIVGNRIVVKKGGRRRQPRAGGGPPAAGVAARISRLRSPS
ncbi:MAG: hypothetical protein ABI886_18395, partial [Betaproteobacteria bacterium]